MKNKTNQCEVLAVVVTYNRKELLKENISALLSQSYKDMQILVVDNASTDGTDSVVKEFKDLKITYVNTGSNLGGAGGFNYGLRYGYENFDNKYFWIMDDDTIPNSDSLEKLIKAKDTLNDEFGFLSSKTLWTDGTMCQMNIPNVAKKIFEKEKYFEAGLIPLKSATFVSCFFKREIVKELGLPMKEFFIWCDDTEYTTRISKKYASYFVNDSVVIHKMKSNSIATNFAETDKNRVDRLFYNYRNKFYIDKQNGIKGFLKGFFRCIKYFFLYLIKGKSKFRACKTLLKALFAGCVFNPKIEYVEESEVKNDKL